MNGSQQKEAERRKFFTAFNSTMIKIWKERIALLGVMDTGALYRSVMATQFSLSPDASEAAFSQEFRTYGLWQNYGTGREVARGNPGDIGRPKVRKARRWFDIKYFASVMNLRDFVADNLGRQYLAMMSNALSDKAMRQSVTL